MSDELVEGPVFGHRQASVLLRNAVAAADKLAQVGTITLSGSEPVGGVLVPGTTYYCSAAAYNRWGNALPASVVSAAPGGTNNSLRLAFAAVAGAVGYDIFLSVDAGAPKWVARITAAQHATGGVITSVGGSVTAGGAANSIDIGVPGTGLQTTANPFLINNGYRCDVIGNAGIIPISCAGFSTLHLKIKMAVTDLRSLPTLKILPFFISDLGSGDWYQGTLTTVNLLTAAGQTLEQDFSLTVDEAAGLQVLVDTITGQGAAVSIEAQLT